MMSGTMNSGPRGGGRILLQQVPHVQSREAADADEGAKVVPSLLPTAQGRTTLADQETLDTNMLEAYTILDSPIPFTSAAGWKNVCLQHYERLAAQTTIMATKYLAFCNVCEDDLVAIDRSRRNLPTLRILYDSTMELLIVKLMVGKAHEWATNLFCDLLRQKELHDATMEGGKGNLTWPCFQGNGTNLTIGLLWSSRLEWHRLFLI